LTQHCARTGRRAADNKGLAKCGSYSG